MALLTSGGEMIRTVHEMFVRPDWVHFFYICSVLCVYVYILPIIRFCNWMTHDFT